MTSKLFIFLQEENKREYLENNLPGRLSKFSKFLGAKKWMMGDQVRTYVRYMYFRHRGQYIRFIK